MQSEILPRDKWVKEEDIELKLPQAPEEVDLLYNDISKLLDEIEDVDPDVYKEFREHPTELILVYVGNTIAGGVRITDLSAKTSQLSGVTTSLFRRRGVSHYVTRTVLSRTFNDKRNVITKIPPDNKGAKGFVWRWGFRKINREAGLDVYKLTREDFNERMGRYKNSA
jgi:hypothetical protein